MDLFNIVKGLWYSVPLIAVLVAARALEQAGGAHPLARVLAGAAAGAAVLAGIVLWTLGLPRIDPEDPTILAAASAALLPAGVASLLLLNRRVRSSLFDALGLDPDSWVHAVSAITYVATITSFAALIVVTQGNPQEPILLHFSDLFAPLLVDGAIALAGVGFLVTRELKTVLERLDLRPISARQFVGAILVAGLFFAAAGLMSHVQSLILSSVFPPEDRFPLKFGTVPSFGGALLASLAAGLGEEALFRGALQPRFGIFPTALLFAAAHTQYQVPDIFTLFLFAVGLGLIKERTSTTFVACIHIYYSIATFAFPGW